MTPLAPVVEPGLPHDVALRANVPNPLATNSPPEQDLLNLRVRHAPGKVAAISYPIGLVHEIGRIHGSTIAENTHKSMGF